MMILTIFWFQMVATEESPSTVPGQIEAPGTFGKLRQTLSSSLLTAQDKGLKYTLVLHSVGTVNSTSRYTLAVRY
jgi:hypothetical protein